MLRFVSAATLVIVCLNISCPGQTSQADSQDNSLTRPPRWFNLGVELRARTQFFNGGDRDAEERLYLNRLRLNVKIEPARWVRFVFQGQDARAFQLSGGPAADGMRDTMDIRLGYVELGHAENGWSAMLGRQELSLGDERLLAADNEWDIFGQSFDAVKFGWQRGRLRFQTFTGFLVEQLRRRPDPLDSANRVSGLTAEWSHGESGLVQPYLLWKRGGETFDPMGHAGHRDIVTPGVLLHGGLPASLDYNVEMAVQRGHVADEPVSAWAGHWELGWRPFGPDTAIRVNMEYNFASGDRDCADGRHGTFDDHYPANYNRYGMLDPFAWRNIRYPEAGITVPLSRRWTAAAGLRAYWLAERRDALYRQGEEEVAHAPDADSAWVGNHLHLSLSYQHSPQWRVAGGYARLRAGDYLRQAGVPLGANSVYLLLLYSR